VSASTDTVTAVSGRSIVGTRSDTLRSHRFVLARVVGALAFRDPDPPAAATRGTAGGLLAGALVAVVGVAAVAGYGVLHPGASTAWRNGQSVIVERETGAVFVFRDGRLHPMLNYTSALLVLGAVRPGTVLVSGAALAGIPRTGPVGIPGAPATLPPASALLNGAWTLCSRPAGRSVESVLRIGRGADRPGQPVRGRALFAVTPAGDLALVTNDHRYAIRDPEPVLTALDLRTRNPMPVAPAVLSAIPPGPDLGRVHLPWGSRSGVPGYPTGQVFTTQTQGGTREYGVAVPAGLAAVTQVQADLILADPAAVTAKATSPVALTPAAFGQLPVATSLIPTGTAAPPATTPTPIDPPGGTVCASIGAESTAVTVGDTVGRSPGELRTGGDGTGVADWVYLPPGHASVVEARPPGAASGQLNLVTDLGTRYPVPSVEVLAMLGFAGVRPQPMPAAVVALVPAGRVLEPAAAAVPVGS
jgi:ESX secretion system ATPase EccB